MISFLSGTLKHKVPDHCVVDVGGVGYRVNTSLSTFAMLPETNEGLNIYIHTYVREDQLQLFGFIKEQERQLFLKLIAISGVGPKMALAILSGLPAEQLIKAIVDGNKVKLSTIPGVGKKTAERIVIELRDKLNKIQTEDDEILGTSDRSMMDDALSALTNLGYQKQRTLKVLRDIDMSENIKIEELIKTALQELSRV